MKQITLSLSLFFVFSSSSFSQNNSPGQPVKKKEHYRIINNGADDPMVLEKALYHAFLDSLRFMDSRRRINVEGTTLVLELYSAKELQETYGKQINLQTIKDPLKAKKIKLKINSSNMVEVVGEK